MTSPPETLSGAPAGYDGDGYHRLLSAAAGTVEAGGVDGVVEVEAVAGRRLCACRPPEGVGGADSKGLDALPDGEPLPWGRTDRAACLWW